MKILTVHMFFSSFGGGEVIAYNTFNLFKENGHETYFFATNKEPFWENDYSYIKYFPNYTKSVKNFLLNPVKYYWNNEAKNNFEKMLNEVKPDIVHIHGIRWLTYSILEPCKKFNIPVVQTVHDSSLVCPVSTLLKKNKYYCSNIDCKKGNYINCIINNCDKKGLEASFRNTMFDTISLKTNSYKKISKFITPSNALRKLILDADIGITDDKIVTVNNFLEDSFIQTPVNYTNKGYFLYSGRLSEEKGVQYLLEAATQLPKEIEFHIVGNGPKKNEFKQFVKDKNLNNVKFLGFLSRDKIAEEYKNCIAGIHPCNWFENFPTSNMEFFAYGKPVIGSDIGGISEQIEHGKTGLLFESANVNELKENILYLYNNFDLTVEMGKNAKQKAIRQYSKERYYNEILQIYESVV